MWIVECVWIFGVIDFIVNVVEVDVVDVVVGDEFIDDVE